MSVNKGIKVWDRKEHAAKLMLDSFGSTTDDGVVLDSLAKVCNVQVCEALDKKVTASGADYFIKTTMPTDVTHFAKAAGKPDIAPLDTFGKRALFYNSF